MFSTQWWSFKNVGKFGQQLKIYSCRKSQKHNQCSASSGLNVTSKIIYCFESRSFIKLKTLKNILKEHSAFSECLSLKLLKNTNLPEVSINQMYFELFQFGLDINRE